ncbi:hypothetical protein GQX74_014124 [Glossina fuscipes]|nr:hypothetical protein GQX74_014124 [Glossina fuscipes]
MKDILMLKNRRREIYQHGYVTKNRYQSFNAMIIAVYREICPSFYHLHVHINPIRHDAPGIWCEKSHMLGTVMYALTF